jgi:U32 family peptidase
VSAWEEPESRREAAWMQDPQPSSVNPSSSVSKSATGPILKWPEVLSPAGSQDALEAALAAGASAVYFGLDEGFNARARASNFPVAQLPETVAKIHAAGAKAYLALNTLIFETELSAIYSILEAAANAGVDALIIQDPAVALLARQNFPSLELHASTQLTISSPQGSKFAEDLGFCQVVLPRELSLEEIEHFVQNSPLRTEVFIAGALCMAWSGQCLSSEAWGGRSANRGQCAQACRLPYDLEVDGEIRRLGGIEYLLSPQDLAGYRAVQRLVELGVHTLKIEGRQKDAEYVYQATKSVKGWIDSAIGKALPVEQLQQDLRDLSLSYSRGLSQGFFEGANHQTFVPGDTPRHRGAHLGTISDLKGRRLRVRQASENEAAEVSQVTSDPLQTLAIPVIELQPGMGVVIRHPGMTQDQEVGGAIFEVTGTPGDYWLDLGARGPRMSPGLMGAQVYLTSDPQLEKRNRQSIRQFRERPHLRGQVELSVDGQLEQPLRISGRLNGVAFALASDGVLTAARSQGLNRDLLLDKLVFSSDSGFGLLSLDCTLGEMLFIPVSELKSLRRRLIEELERLLPEAPLKVAPSQIRQASPEERQSAIASLQGSHQSIAPGSRSGVLLPLCRTMEQLEAVIDCGFEEVTLDWMEMIGLTKAVQRAREAGLKVGIATVRVQKPLEHGYDRRIAALKPDSVLLRHWGGLVEFSQMPASQRPTLHGDFSLNVTNSVTANYLFGLGLQTLTASHDLDRAQLGELCKFADPTKLTVALHHHLSTFHTEHCVYSHLLSDGTDYRSCGRPCESHKVGLRDRKGITHPVVVDVGCRNTVFNGQAQSAARMLEPLREMGISQFRLEFVWEDRQTTTTILQTYQSLLAGKLELEDALTRLGVLEQFGVTLGTMKVLQG